MRLSSIRFVTTLAVAILSISASAEEQHTRVTNPMALSVEGLGRGGLFSVNFDHVLSDHFAAGAGVGTVNAGGTSSLVVPMYGNYYFMKDKGSIYATLGVSILTTSLSGATSQIGSITFADSGLMFTAGAGWESRLDSGFLFRATGYILYTNSVFPWVGGSFGYSF